MRIMIRLRLTRGQLSIIISEINQVKFKRCFKTVSAVEKGTGF